MHLYGGDYEKNIKYLSGVWEQINSAGKNSNIIEAEEVEKNTGLIFFVEEGMRYKDFESKNLPIEAETRQNPHSFNKLNEIVINMIDNGEFAQKKDIILGKVMFLYKDTLIRILDELATNKEEQKEFYEKLLVYGAISKEDYSIDNTNIADEKKEEPKQAKEQANNQFGL